MKNREERKKMWRKKAEGTQGKEKRGERQKTEKGDVEKSNQCLMQMKK